MGENHNDPQLWSVNVNTLLLQNDLAELHNLCKSIFKYNLSIKVKIACKGWSSCGIGKYKIDQDFNIGTRKGVFDHVVACNKVYLKIRSYL